MKNYRHNIVGGILLLLLLPVSNSSILNRASFHVIPERFDWITVGLGLMATVSASEDKVRCVEDKGVKYCSDEFTTRYVSINNNGSVNERFCRAEQEDINNCSKFNKCEIMKSQGGTSARWVDNNKSCGAKFIGAKTCWQQAPQDTDLAAVVVAVSADLKCCGKGDVGCINIAQESFLKIPELDKEAALKIAALTKKIEEGGNIKVAGNTTNLILIPDDASGVVTKITAPGSGLGGGPGGSVTPTIPIRDVIGKVPSVGGINPSNSSNFIGSNPGAVRANPYSGTSNNRYQIFSRPQTLQQKPRSFIQRFAGGNSAVQRLSNFVTGGQADLRNSPEGLQGGGVQPQVIYVTPDFATPRGLNNENFRSIQAIASDISAQTQPTLARVDRFAQTLTAVGGPNAINTENKSFGRIQDLIIEDEAIRSLRVAEERGNRAKNRVFCKVDETSANCNERREVKAKEVERESFVEELEKRVLPESAIQHFLAVYDGWVRPSPAPATYATSTLALLNSQGSIPEQPYKIVTNGSAFVSWIVDSVSDATTKAVTTLTNLITGGFRNEEVAQ